MTRKFVTTPTAWGNQPADINDGAYAVIERFFAQVIHSGKEAGICDVSLTGYVSWGGRRRPVVHDGTVVRDAGSAPSVYTLRLVCGGYDLVCSVDYRGRAFASCRLLVQHGDDVRDAPGGPFGSSFAQFRWFSDSHTIDANGGFSQIFSEDLIRVMVRRDASVLIVVKLLECQRGCEDLRRCYSVVGTETTDSLALIAGIDSRGFHVSSSSVSCVILGIDTEGCEYKWSTLHSASSVV